MKAWTLFCRSLSVSGFKRTRGMIEIGAVKIGWRGKGELEKYSGGELQDLELSGDWEWEGKKSWMITSAVVNPELAHTPMPGTRVLEDNSFSLFSEGSIRPGII